MHADNVRAQELIDAGEADLAVLLEPPPERRSPRLEFRLAYAIEYLAVFPPRHPLARKKRLRLSDLLAQPLLVGHSETFVRKALEFAVHQRGAPAALQVVVETDNSALTIACVRQGMGVGVIAGREGGELLGGLPVRSLRSTLGEARIVVAHKRGLLLPAAMAELIAAICGIGGGPPNQHSTRRATAAGPAVRVTVRAGSPSDPQRPDPRGSV
jgi:DNA-binding transcriptional LysR family regulator